MEKLSKISMKLSALALSVGIYAAIGLLAGIITFLVSWIFMLVVEMEEEDGF